VALVRAGPLGAGRDQARLQRGALRSAARRRRGDHRRGEDDAPVPGHGRGCAARQAGRQVRRRPAARGDGLRLGRDGRTSLPGNEMLYAWRSFEAYPIIAATTGATSIRVPNTATHGHDLPAMAAAVTDRTGMILVCNPNNPTGPALHREELDAFLDAVPENV